MDTTVQDPLVGRLLDGRYQVTRLLAHGGMATVYTALDTRLDRPVALKVMHRHLAADGDFVARFIREAKAAARLSHPGVVAVYDQGTDGPHVYLAMEYVAGRTLRDVLTVQRRLAPREALEVLEPVVAALAAAHGAGLVHRDVKPENVLLADDGRVKVADFGLARAVAAPAGTTQGVLLGTVAYLSPEQVARGISDPRSDVYAVGILLFELLTGQKPYDGDNPLQVAFRHVQEDMPAPSSRVPGIPASLDALVRRMTSRDPDERPADAGALLGELLAVRRSLPATPDDTLTVAMSLPTSNPTLVVPGVQEARRHVSGAVAAPYAPPRRRRRRAGLIVLAVLLAMAGALAGVAWWLGSGPGAYTTMPRLLALSQAEAVAKARAEGLDVKVSAPAFDEQVERGRVLDTDPDPGSRVRKNATITLTLSAGRERHAVPRVVGMTRAQAVATLKRARLTAGSERFEYSDTVAAGRVMSTSPVQGEPLRRDAAVALVFSRGVEQRPVQIVVGQPGDAATAALTDAGFQVATEEEFSESVSSGRVIRQSPAGGKAVKGSTVTVIVSKGPPLVQIPRLVGRNVDQAVEDLRALGFVPDVRRLPAGPGIVLDTNPNGGRSAPKGSTITVSVF